MVADDFIGRSRELSAISQAFARGARLVTIVGGPGFGKTRLATEWLRRERTDAYLCDVSECTDDASWCAVVETALGKVGADRSTPPSAQGIGLTLAALERPLVVFDALEHAVDVARPLIRAWLTTAPALRILVTSRIALGLSGEERVLLGPLSTERTTSSSDAAKLFFARAARAHPALSAPSPPVVAQVEELAERLDGNPLAIELAAARVGLTGLDELVRRVGVALDVLGDTLDAAVRSSWELASPAARDCLRVCATLRGGFELTAIEALIGGDALSRLAELQHSSLLHSEVAPSGRARMRLYDAVRDFVLRTDPPDEAMLARQARYFLESAQSSVSHATGGDAEAIGRLLEERANVLAAFEWACARGERELAQSSAPAISTIGQATLPVDRTVTLLGRAIDLGSGPHTAHALLERASVRRQGGDLDGADGDLASIEGLGIALDPTLKARFALERGALCVYRFHIAQAEQWVNDALTIARRIGDRIAEGRALNQLGALAFYRGQAADGVAHFVAASEVALASGDPARGAWYLANAGLSRLDGGALDEAERFLVRAADIAQRGGCATQAALARGYLGVLARARGQLTVALEETNHAAAALLARGMQREAAHFLAGSGEALRALGRLDEAAARLRRARDLSAAVVDRAGVAIVSAQLGALCAMRDSLEEAAREFAIAEDRTLPEPVVLAVALERGHADLAEARRARREGSADVAEQAMSRARETLARAHATHWVILPLMLARDALEAALRGLSPRPSLQLADDEARVGSLVLDLRRRPVARRILFALAKQAVERPGTPLAGSTLIAAAWPGERMRPESAKNRLHAAIAQLRKLGLRDVLVTIDDGYAIDASVVVDGGSTRRA